MNFSGNLRKYRTAKGFSQDKLAEISGIQQNLIAKYELGTRIPNVINGVILAEALDVTVEKLVGLDKNFLQENLNK